MYFSAPRKALPTRRPSKWCRLAKVTPTSTLQGEAIREGRLFIGCSSADLTALSLLLSFAEHDPFRIRVLLPRDRSWPGLASYHAVEPVLQLLVLLRRL